MTEFQFLGFSKDWMMQLTFRMVFNLIFIWRLISQTILCHIQVSVLDGAEESKIFMFKSAEKKLTQDKEMRY